MCCTCDRGEKQELVLKVSVTLEDVDVPSCAVVQNAAFQRSASCQEMHGKSCMCCICYKKMHSLPPLMEMTYCEFTKDTIVL